MAAFDPDQFLSGGTAVAEPPAFNPDEYLGQSQGGFDPDKYLSGESFLKKVGDVLSTATEGVARGLLGPANLLLSKEQLQAPLASPETMKYMMPYAHITDAAAKAFPDSQVAQIPKAVTDAMTNTASGFTSPENLALLGAAPESAAAQRLVAGTFLGQSILGTPEQWKAFQAAPKLADKIRIATEMGLGLALPAAGLLHARAGEVPKPIQERPSQQSFAEVAGGPLTESALSPRHEPSKTDQLPPVLSEDVSASEAASRPQEPILQSEPRVDSTKISLEVNAPSVQEVPLANQQGEFPPKANPEAQGVSDTTGQMESQPTSTDPQAAAGTSNRVFRDIYGQDAIPGGHGVDTAQLLDNARASIRTGAVDPYSILSETRKRGIANQEEFAALAAEHERLVNDAVAKQKASDPSAPEAAKRAEEFANAIQPHKTAASDLMRLFQGELNYDLSTPFGMDQYMKSELGRGMKPSEKPAFEKRALEIRLGENGVRRAITNSDVKVQRHYAKVRDIPMEEAASRVREWLKDCQV